MNKPILRHARRVNDGGGDGELPVNVTGLRLLMIGLALLAAEAARADCPPPAPPAVLAEAATLADGAVVRAVGGAQTAPYLEIMDRLCHPLARLGSAGGSGAEDATSLLRFRVADIAGLPRPLIIVVIASPGGSDTAFSTQLLAASHGHWRSLLPRPATSLLEGGVFVGPLGRGLGVGVAVWNFVWARSEAHVSPHRYVLQRYRWTGAAFVALPPRTTRGKYRRPEPALAELGVGYQDVSATMPGFAQLR